CGLKRKLMRFARIGTFSNATATAFPSNGYRASPDGNSDPGDIGGGILMIGRIRPNTTRGQSVSVPGVIAKDAVSLGDNVPAFYIGERSAFGMTHPDELGIELGLETLHLSFTKCHFTWSSQLSMVWDYRAGRRE